jgi:predicted molibdopterin-dependent oxidoreductase YjgC
MHTDSLFQPLARASASVMAPVAVTFNGRPLQVPAGSSVAAALLAAGVKRFRKSPISGNGRAPYCMMGVCFECLLEIDGIPNRQGCLVPLRAGMDIRTQDNLPDLLDSADDQAMALAQASVGGAHHGV